MCVTELADIDASSLTPYIGVMESMIVILVSVIVSPYTVKSPRQAAAAVVCDLCGSSFQVENYWDP